MDAAIGELEKALRLMYDLELAIARSEDTHGVHAPSNRRNRLYTRHARACNRAIRAYGKVVEIVTLSRLRRFAREAPLSTLPTDTSRQWRAAADQIGSKARAFAPGAVKHELRQAGMKPLGLTDVEIAYWRSVKRQADLRVA